MNTPHRIILSLGSNERKETNMQEAMWLLQVRFPSLLFSEPVLTEPIETKSMETKGRLTEPSGECLIGEDRKETVARDGKETAPRYWKEVTANESLLMKSGGGEPMVKEPALQKAALQKSVAQTPAPRAAVRNSVWAAPFLNCVAIGYVSEDPEALRRILKAIEHRLGRRPEDKAAGRIPIDIDLLQWNEEVLKPADLSRGYVIQGIASLLSLRE